NPAGSIRRGGNPFRSLAGNTGRSQSRRLVIRTERDTPRDQHFVDHAFADDFVELVFDLSPQRLKARFGSAAQLVRIALRYNGAHAIHNQGPALLNYIFYVLLVFAAGDGKNAHVVEERST